MLVFFETIKSHETWRLTMHSITQGKSDHSVPFRYYRYLDLDRLRVRFLVRDLDEERDRDLSRLELEEEEDEPDFYEQAHTLSNTNAS